MKIKLFILFVLAGSSLWAQDRSPAIEEAVARQTAHFELRPDQVEQMYVIEERRARNLAEIEVLRESDYRLYLQKKQDIRTHIDGNIRQILDKEQRMTLDEDLRQYRMTTSNLIRQMQEQGKPKEEIELMLLERG
ncbi:MAG: hypothetical protein AAFP77_13370 [Bacteroidota bacterium]